MATIEAVQYYRGRIKGMPTVKRSISFDPTLLARAEATAERETGGNLSALVGEALEQRVKSDLLSTFLAEEIERIGGIPPEIKEEVDREWAEIFGT
jgi:hypothetical protein